MIYIKRLDKNSDEVRLGGQVATDWMIEEGWFEYDGPLPSSGTNFKLVDGVVVAFTPELDTQSQIIQYKKYLDDTDHKLFADYEAKPGEDLDAIKSRRKIARDFIRENTIVLPDGPESNS